MTRLMTALALSGALIAQILPAAAEGMTETMTCAEFMAMTPEDQMSAMTEAMAMHDEMASDDAMATEDAMATDDAMAMDEDMTAMTEACAAAPDMMVMDAMGSM